MPEQQVDLDLGKVVGDPGASLRFRDAWNSGSEYRNDATYIDVVQHNGSLWVCKQTNTGQTPSSSSEYWGLGAQGIRQAGEMLQGRLLYLSANGMDTSTVSNADLEELVQANVPEKIGTLSDLKTSAKGNLVAAVNELNGKISGSALPYGIIDSSILNTVKGLTRGIYLFYTQNASDSPSSGNVSFMIVNKAGTDFIYMYVFCYEGVYYASANATTPSISWTNIGR